MEHKQATIAVRGGLNHDQQFGSVVPPITLSTTYNFTDFNQPRKHDYSRRGNPTRDMAQQVIAELEQGAGAVFTSSGMSAIHLLSTVILQPGDLLVAPHDCYGGSYRLFDSLSRRGAYQVLFIDQNDPLALADALARKPKLVLIETPSNPLLRIIDIAEVCRLSHEAGALVAVDNTFLSPILQQPIKLGADFVIHSCTKYLNGHSDIIAGAVVSKDPEFAVEMAWWANNLGLTGAAFDSYLLLRGIRTLNARVLAQQQTTTQIVDYLIQHLLVKKLYYPGLINHPGHAIAVKQQRGFGALLSLELNGDEVVLRNALKKLQLFTLAESLGGVESLICHPATMTHAGMHPEARKVAGISDNLLRISVGLESAEDLIADLARAFAI